MDISKKQLQIIELTGKMLIHEGASKLTIKNLAAGMNFSESAIYRHFPSKEAIIITLLDLFDDYINTQLYQEIKKENSATENLINAFRNQFEYLNKNRHFIIAILSDSIFDESETLNQVIIKIMTSHTALITKLIDEGKIRNEFHTGFTTQSLVHLLMASFRLHILKWKLSKFNINIEAEGIRQVEVFLKLIKIN